VGHSRECCFFLVSVVVWKEACERFKKEKSGERRRSGERRARVEVHFENSRANVSADPRCPEARGVLLLFADSAIRQGPARSARSWEGSETRERSRPRTSIPEPSPRATTRLFFSSTGVRREHGTVPRPLALWYYSYFYSLSLTSFVSSSSPGSTRAARNAAAAAAASPARGSAEGALAAGLVVADDDRVEGAIEGEGLERVNGGRPGRSMLDMASWQRRVKGLLPFREKGARRRTKKEGRNCREQEKG